MIERFADSFVFLAMLNRQDRRHAERGTHKELVAAGGKYAHLYEQFVQHAE